MILNNKTAGTTYFFSNDILSNEFVSNEFVSNELLLVNTFFNTKYFQTVIKHELFSTRNKKRNNFKGLKFNTVNVLLSGVSSLIWQGKA